MKAALCFLLLLPSLALSQSVLPDSVHTWQTYEVKLTASRDYDDPYLLVGPDEGDDLVYLVFQGVDGRAQGEQVKIVGFWDGERTWKVRFAPPSSGTWRYESVSRDPGLNGIKGTLRVIPWTEQDLAENPARRGFIQVNTQGDRAGRYFKYADGTPFLWVGDTWWNWTKRSIQFETFENLVDDRAAKGFTIGQLFVAANGWGRESSILDETYTRPDLELLRKVDRMIEYANEKGITVWVHGWWSRENLDDRIGSEKIRRWWRYLLHRLGSYNVIWVLAGEYNMHDYAGLGLTFWKDLGHLLDREDPYHRIIGTHNTPPGWEGGADAPQWSTGEVIHNEPWLDYNQSQVGHGRWRNELIPDIVALDYARQPAKPIVVTEPWYEFIEGNPTGLDVRFGAWSAILSGAAGHTYGGGHIWLAHVPESPGGGGAWPLEESFDRSTLDYPGAQSMGHLSTFLHNLAWWTLEIHPELVQEYADPYCAAVPGSEYVVYLRWGGGAKIDLLPSSPDDVFLFRWYDPSSGQYVKEGQVRGGAVQFFSPPEDYPAVLDFKDWILHIKKN